MILYNIYNFFFGKKKKQQTFENSLTKVEDAFSDVPYNTDYLNNLGNNDDYPVEQENPVFFENPVMQLQPGFLNKDNLTMSTVSMSRSQKFFIEEGPKISLDDDESMEELEVELLHNIQRPVKL